MDRPYSLKLYSLQKIATWLPFQLWLIAFISLFLAQENSAQVTILSDPGMSYTNSDGPTGPDVYSVDVSTCTSISFSVDYSFSLPWEGDGNMEYCTEVSPTTGQPVCIGSPTCACDPFNSTAGGCNFCWDFLWARFHLDGVQVGGDIIGDAGTTDAEQFGTIASGPICTDGAMNADITMVTQTWAANETATFTNLIILCWQGTPTIVTNSPLCEGDNLTLNGTAVDPTVITTWAWSNDGTGMIANPNAQNTIATNPQDGETYSLTVTDVNACTATDDVTISVLLVPNTGVPAAPQDVCNASNTNIPLNDLLTGEDTGGTWTETSGVPSTGGAFNPVPGTFNPFNQNAGTYTFEYAIPGIPPCPGDMSTVTIVVSDSPNAGTPNPALQECNTNNIPIDLAGELTGEDPGGTWTETSVPPSTGGAFNALAGTFNPFNQAAGTYTFEYTVMGIAPCPNATSIVTTIVNAGPAAGTANPPMLLCNDSSTPIVLNNELNGEDPGGTWVETSGTPSTGGAFNPIPGTFNPNGQAAGMYTFQYTVTGTPPCTDDMATVTINIQEAPNAGTANVPLELCNSSNTPVLLSDELFGEDPGGTWTETSTIPSSGGAFDPFLGSFNPNGQTSGLYTFEYTLIAAPPCMSASETVTIIVSNGPNAGIANLPITLCNNSNVPTILADQLIGEDLGGTWTETSTIPSTGGAFNPFLGTFNPNGQTIGIYTFDYTLTATPPCPDAVSTITIIIENGPNAGTANPSLTVCNTDNTLLILENELTGEDAGGSWMETSTIPSTGAAFDPFLGTFNPDGQAAGTYTFEYTVSANTSCPDDMETVTIIIENGPNAGMANPALSLCNSSNTSILLSDELIGEDSGGSWTETSSAPSTGGAFDAGAGTFNPDGQAAGTYTFDYTVAGTAPCVDDVATVTIVVAAAVNAGTANPMSSFCNSENSPIGLAGELNGEDAGGSWVETSATPSTGGAFDAGAGTFNPDGQAAGIYTFEYTLVGTAPCPDDAETVSINIEEAPDAGTPNAPLPICNSSNTAITLANELNGEDPGGLWVEISTSPSTGGAFNASAGTFNPNGQNAGTYTFEYSLSAIAPCVADQDTISIIVEAEPFATVETNATICNLASQGSSLDFNSFVTAGDLGGNWVEVTSSGVSLVDLSNVDFDGITAGSYTFTYTTNSANAPCTEQSYDLVVLVQDCACPDVATIAPADLCNDNGSLDLNTLVSTSEPGNWAITSTPAGTNPATLTGTLFDASGADAGDYQITYTLDIAPIAGCPDSSVQTITVFDLPNAGTALPALEVCNSSTTLIDLPNLLTGEDAGGSWVETSATPSTGGAFNPGAQNFDPNGQAAATYTFEYSVNGNAPCPNASSTVTVIMQAEPFAIVETNATICNLASQGSSLDFNSFVTAGDLGGNWVEVTSSGVSLADLSNVDFDGITAGSYTFTYTTNSASAPCTEQSYDLVVLVQDCACPDVATIAPADLCNDNGSLDLSTLVSTIEPGTWAITSTPAGTNPATLTGTLFDASAADAGDYQITYTLDIAPIAGCPDSSVQTITVHPTPMATVQSNATICNLASQGSSLDFNSFVTAGDLGGNWVEVTSSGVSLADLSNVDFDGITAGSYTFTYTTNSATAPCTEQSYDLVVLVQDCACPDVATIAPADLCNDNGSLDLSTLVSTIEPGTWTITSTPAGTNPATLTGTLFDASAADPGDYQITYTLNIAPIAGCPDSSVQTITVHPTPMATVQSNATICNLASQGSSLDFNSFVTAGDLGGNWIEVTGSGVSLADLSNVDFDGITAGSYTFTYTTNSANAPCTEQSYDLVVLVQDCACPDVSTTAPADLCNDNGSLDLSTLVSTIEPGTWAITSTPAGTNPATLTGTLFDASGADSGDYQITYTLDIAPIAGCPDSSVQTITVHPTPMATVQSNATICNLASQGSSLDFTSFVTAGDLGGNWIEVTGSGVSLADLSNVDFDGITAGSYTFTYTTNSANAPCTEQSYDLVVLVQDCACPDVSTTAPADLCNDNGSLDLSTLVSTVEPGSWTITATPVGSNPATLTGTLFDASAADAGDYQITYTLNIAPIAGCPDSSVQTITVIASSNSGIDLSPITVCNNSILSIPLNDLLAGEDVGGSWTETSTLPSTGLAFDAIAGTFTPSGQASGSYTFEYSLAGMSPCGNVSTTVTIEVEERPFAVLITDTFTCNNNVFGSVLNFNSFVLGGDLGGSWVDTDGTGVNLADLTMVDFDGILAGTYTFTYTTSSAQAACTEQSYDVSIEVRNCTCPSVATLSPGSICNNGPLDLSSYVITSESGTWSITATPVGSNPATLIGTTFLASGADPGIYEITFTLDNPVAGCPTSSVQNITLFAAPNAGLAGSTQICNPGGGQIIDLFSVLTGGMSGGVWNIDASSPQSPLPGSLDPINGTFDPFNQTSGTYVFIYAVVGSPFCPPATTTATVTINQVAATINGVLEFCVGGNTTLYATPGFANYNWSLAGNTADSLVVSVANTYQVTVSDASGCSDVAVAQVVELPVAMGNLDTVLCIGNSITINGTVYDSSNPIGTETLVGAASTGCDSVLDITVSYYPIADSLIQRTLCPNESIVVNGTIYDRDNPNGNEWILGAAEHGCDSTVIIDLSFVEEATASLSGDTVVCMGDTATIFFNFTGMGPFDIIYSFNSNNIPLSGLSNGASIDIVINAMTTFSLVSVTSTLNPTCPVLLPSNGLTITATEVALVVDASSDYNGYGVSCNGETDGTLLATASNGTGPYNYNWDNGSNGQSLENIGAGSYGVTTTDANGCTNETVVSLSAPPDPSIDLELEDPTCFGDSDGSLIITDINGPGSNYSFSVNGGIFQEVSSLPYVLPGLSAGVYQLVVQDENDCGLEESISLSPAGEIGLDLGADQNIELGDSVLLDPILTINPADWEWTPVEDLNCIDCLTTYALPFNTVTYSLTVWDSLGCEQTDDVTIQVRKNIEVYIPNGFSPNGNGDNDFFYVQTGRNDINIKSLRVFDRWGELVFSRLNFEPNIPDLGWDGTLRGQQMNPAVFVYIVELEFIDSRTEILSGDLTLIR